MDDGLIYGFTREIHERAEILIEQDIFCCDSMLIDALLADDIVWNDCFSIDQIENYFDDSIDAIEEFLTYDSQLSPDEWRDLSFDQRKTFAHQHGFDPQPNEIYEWWRVSSRLADDLIAASQPVLRNCYGNWWGRCVTGQCIILDGTLQRIVERWNLFD